MSNNKVVIEPKGKRNRKIIIEGIYNKNETEDDINNRNEVIAKTLISYGLKT